MTTYKIVRLYPYARRRTIKTGFTLEEAKAHCSNKETSSRTAKSYHAKERTRKFGLWFDGYIKES